jgi:hypothetical protein
MPSVSAYICPTSIVPRLLVAVKGFKSETEVDIGVPQINSPDGVDALELAGTAATAVLINTKLTTTISADIAKTNAFLPLLVITGVTKILYLKLHSGKSVLSNSPI